MLVLFLMFVGDAALHSLHTLFRFARHKLFTHYVCELTELLLTSLYRRTTSERRLSLPHHSR